jgi:hypothetical protein
MGGLFVGALAEQTGAPSAVAIGSSIYLAAIVIIGFSVREVRDLNGRQLEGSSQ